MNFAYRWLQAGTISLALGLAACGGGGEDPKEADASIRIGAPVPASIKGDYVPNSSATLKLSGTINGDLNKLNGKQIYVTIEDPDALFLPQASLNIVRAGSDVSYSLDLTKKTSLAIRRYTGNLRIFVCLDTACKEPLGNTPLTVPYDIRVVDGLRVDTSMLTIEVPFGTVPNQIVRDVYWPSSSKGWESMLGSIVDPNRPANLIDWAESATVSTSPQLKLNVAPMKPGSFDTKVHISADVPLSFGGKNTLTTSFTVRYTVLPNPALDAFFFPARLDITLPRQAGARAYRYDLVENTDVTSSFIGVEYLSAAGTTGPVNAWWQEAATPLVATCTGTVSAANCLTPGVYTAQLRHRVTSVAGAREVLLPISLTVTP